MSPRITIDPVTRISGHLRVVCEIDPDANGGGVVRDAYVQATLFRGLDVIMRGRDPRDCVQLAQRICGMCPTSHAFNAAKALEGAFGLLKVPNNARLVRNMLESAQILFDHVTWFYQLNLPDYVDVYAAARRARPKAPSLARLQSTLREALDAGRGPFPGGWWSHPAYRLPPDAALELMAHYVQALDIQAAASKASALLGGKSPMLMSYAAGGLTHLPDVETVSGYRTLMGRVHDFVEQVLLPDALLIAQHHTELARQGLGHGHYLTWGVLDRESQDPIDRLFPQGIVRAGEMRVAQADPSQVRLFTKRSFFPDDAGGGRHPLNAGQGTLSFHDPARLHGKYDWTQAPRYGSVALPVETGPVAQLIVAFLKGRGDAVLATDALFAELVRVGMWQHSDVEAEERATRVAYLNSTLGRMLARVAKARVVAQRATDWADQLLESVADVDRQFYSPRPVPDSAEGIGGWDAPRGALCHWVRIGDGLVERYAVVAPSQWNVSPRDDDGVPGPLEKALIGTRVADPDRPLEVLRVVRGFDPCMNCAVHVVEPSRTRARDLRA